MKDMLEGNLAYMPVPDLLQWIDLKRKSCAVSILHDDSGTSLYLEDGKIFYISSERRRFGEFLVGNGILDDLEVQHALAQSRQERKFFTQYLLDEGLLSRQLLTAAFCELADLILLDVFKYRSGAFCVTEHLPDTVLEGPVRLVSERMSLYSVQQVEQRDRERRERRASLDRIKAQVRKGEFQLPALPDMIVHLLSVVEDDNSTFSDMMRIIMTDQVLVSRVLKVANSPLYAAGEQIDSIHLALARMGMRSILNIAIAFKISTLSMPTVPQGKLKGVLDAAIRTAFVAGGLARACRLDPEEAFLGGLLHDLGKTVIYSLAPADFLDDPLFEEYVAEQHAEIGALIAQRWHYPESIGKVILHHHDCRYAGDLDRMVAVVQLADELVEAGDAEWRGDLAADLRLEASVVEQAYQQAMDSYRQARAA